MHPDAPSNKGVQAEDTIDASTFALQGVSGVDVLCFVTFPMLLRQLKCKHLATLACSCVCIQCRADLSTGADRAQIR